MADIPVVEKHTRDVVSKSTGHVVLQLGGHTQLQKATKNPNQANVNTRPYILMGLSPGTERALWLTGLTTGAFHSVVISYMIADSRKTFRNLGVKGREGIELLEDGCPG